MEFPRLDDTNFPNLENVNVYALKNDYDFKRFDKAQMTIHVLNVPWDMGEAHVGQRTITGIGNVVKFENDTERDNWFLSKRYAETPEQWASGNYDGFKWVTKYRQFHNGDDLKIPLPFDVVARFNYAFITYEPAPVDYEHGGLLTWFMFIRNFQMLSVNTTACIVKRDTWQTYINHIRFKGMMYEQGHYPFTLTDVDTYLNNPIENNSGLLEEDITFGELAKVTHSNAVVLNDKNIKCVIVTSASPTANYGSKANNNWKTPNGFKTQDGQPSYYAFAIAPNTLTNFVSNVKNEIPQFIQTIKAVFFIADKLINIGSSFTFVGIACNWIAQKNANFDLLKLAKNQFGYDNKYKHLAKLYTYPYAALEVTDENGNVSLIKIEETSGNLSLQTSVNVAFPWINIDTRLKGIGGNVSQTLNFVNVSSHSFNFSGKWYEYLTQWQIPTFAITQEASNYNDFATHFDRKQQAYQAQQTNANELDSNATQQSNELAINAANYNNAVDAANTGLANAQAANATNKANADASADVSVANVAIQNSTNDTLNNRQNQATVDATIADQNYNFASASISNDVTAETTNNEVEAKYAGAAISGIGGLVSSTASGAISGAALGPPGIAAGAVSGLAGGVVGAITGQMQTAVSNNLLEAQAGVQIRANNAGVETTNSTSGNKTGIQTSLNTTTTDINNQSAAAQTANNAGVIKANAAREQATGDANAARSANTEIGNAARSKNAEDANANRSKATGDAIAARNLSVANSAISNQVAQAALEAPFEFGEFANGETSTTKPLAMVANVVTQNKDAIEKTGDYFLRFGYAYNKYIDFETFNIMPKFSYWKCSDIWVYGLDMADEHMDEIRFFLMGGVTVWRKPEYIGTTSIYENV